MELSNNTCEMPIVPNRKRKKNQIPIITPNKTIYQHTGSCLNYNEHSSEKSEINQCKLRPGIWSRTWRREGYI